MKTIGIIFFSLVAINSFAMPLGNRVRTDLSEEDSFSIFDELNGGAIIIVDANVNQSGHWHFNEANPTDSSGIYPYRTTAYFLSSDKSFRLQCSAVNGVTGNSEAKCFFELDPSLSSPSVTEFTAGAISQSYKIKFLNTDDINSLFQLGDIGTGLSLTSDESVSFKDANGVAVSRDLLTISCAQDRQYCQSRTFQRD